MAVAAAESGRSVDDIRVVAASKAQPDDRTMTLYTYGTVISERVTSRSWFRNQLTCPLTSVGLSSAIFSGTRYVVVPVVDDVQTISSLRLAQTLSASCSRVPNRMSHQVNQVEETVVGRFTRRPLGPGLCCARLAGDSSAHVAAKVGVIGREKRTPLRIETPSADRSCTPT